MCLDRRTVTTVCCVCVWVWDTTHTHTKATAQWILLYGFWRTEQETPPDRSDQSGTSGSHVLPWVPVLWTQKYSAFTESTTWTQEDTPPLTSSVFHISFFWLCPFLVSCPFPVSSFPVCVFFSPFFSLASVSAVEPVAVTGLHVMTTSFFISCHILMSWHSNILASVFFTLRAVRREAGLLAQHSDMSLPICRKHCRQK